MLRRLLRSYHNAYEDVEKLITLQEDLVQEKQLQSFVSSLKNDVILEFE